ncbi:hypothetical protein WJX73_007721 [Symbiochloris irregularis]|uniref:Tyrosine specific protein phosphatases domain-containing protein n=1 Tax=Symbiochloris irregularis TaxID=706552 RepID=A0AAW1PJS2_9CHLO
MEAQVPSVLQKLQKWGDYPGYGEPYTHIHLVAKVFPQQGDIDKVVDTARAFWRDRPAEHIAIHCAYGFNRTGFVVCAYLVLACGLSVDEALACFAKARPPGVRHEKFVQELRRRYEPRRLDADPDPSRSSMGSVHSDMATVAEFLGPSALQHPREAAAQSSSAMWNDSQPGTASSDSFSPHLPSCSSNRLRHRQEAGAISADHRKAAADGSGPCCPA